jgi:very-short-patch-repair endonuclease
MGNNLIAEAAKELRRRQTEAEKILWFRLRDKQLCGVKFRRQEPIGNYIVDFVSFETKLILEIDGNPHREMETKINDNQRTSWLQGEGFRVLRFWNADILNDVKGVLEKIKDNLWQ